MRIISGKLKGRRFHLPKGKWRGRPTTDFAKEGLFNVLENNFDWEAVNVLELFGGTGSLSFEFVSRGCSDVTFVDKYFPCVKFVRQTADDWQVGEAIHPVASDAFNFIKTTGRQYDIIVADPPYDMPRLGELPQLIKQFKLLAPGGWFILEHGQNHQFQNHQDCFMVKKYGKTAFSYFKFDETS